MADTSRFTGIGRLNTILDDIACWRMKLLWNLHKTRETIKECRCLPQYACIWGQTCNRNANVVIYSEHLLLVWSQFSSRSLVDQWDQWTLHADLHVPSTLTIQHESLNAILRQLNLASRLQEHIQLDAIGLEERIQCCRSRRCFETEWHIQ